MIIRQTWRTLEGEPHVVEIKNVERVQVLKFSLGYWIIGREGMLTIPLKYAGRLLEIIGD